ncbi:hypothetical protein [Helicobacter rodentium]|uniref:hypothetical protein n=5 Tax=Helicobacter rodentium TaxID=59617 RepID=UPI00262F076E|nr:hypothetical protein [Helicobacter rodentium]
MAVSFQTNPFKNPFTSSAFENLKPKVNQERNNSDNTESKNTKANTQDTKTTTIESEIKQSLLNITPIDKAHNSLANVMLRNLADALEGGYNEYADMMLKTIIQNSQLPASAANAPGGSKGGVYIGSLFNTTSFESTQNLKLTLSNNLSGESTQTLQYSTSFAVTFNAEFTDKNGNKMATRNQLALGKNLENQLTTGQESIASALKNFFARQIFNVDFDGNFSDFGEGLKSGLDNMLFLFESTGDSISKALQNIQKANAKNPQGDMSALFADLQNKLNSSLSMFVGIPNNEQNNPATKDWLKSSNALTITASYERYSAQWIGKKLDNSESSLREYSSSKSASFKFEA